MSSGLEIRPARESDSEFVWTLSMEPSVLEMSTRGHAFTPEEHVRWWDRRFHEPTTRIYIGETVAGSTIGYVRYGSGPPAPMLTAEVSIAVQPDQRGRGYGTAMLNETAVPAASDLVVTYLRALILPENTASISLFMRAGYAFRCDEWRMGKRHYVYERQVG